MDDTVIVSICSDKKEKDFELPSKITLRDLYPRLLAVLKKNSQINFDKTKTIVLRSEDGYLCDLDATLQQYGVATGAKLELIREE